MFCSSIKKKMQFPIFSIDNNTFYWSL